MTTPDPLRAALTELVRAASEYANASGGISGDLGARLTDARAALAADAARPLDDLFLDEAATALRERFDHGAAKFGRYSWREDGYGDEDNLERLRRAVDHLEAAHRNSDDPAEWRKRAADVANQAFMFADPARLTEDRP